MGAVWFYGRWPATAPMHSPTAPLKNVQGKVWMPDRSLPVDVALWNAKKAVEQAMIVRITFVYRSVDMNTSDAGDHTSVMEA